MASSTSLALPPFQLYVAITPPGGVLRPPPGHYAGPVVIDRPIVIEGRGQVEIDGGGDGTVVTINAPNTVLRGLRITHSGSSHDAVDAGILIQADKVRVENNTLEQVLFGVHMKNANENIVRGNRISSLAGDISLRGDGIRMWYSQRNLIENNRLDAVRDFTASNATNNRIIGNVISNSRIGLELVYSHDNEIAGNILQHDVTGIVVIYSNSLKIHDNRIAHMRKLTGAGLSFKESTGVVVTSNQIVHCAVGLQANSPLDPRNHLIAEDNLFAYNVLGLYFYGEKGGHIIRRNRFENNFTDALGSATPPVRDNTWLDNHWDNYQGFDRDGDGVGDRPHDVYLYAERIWADDPSARFFRGSPALEMIDFAFRLAPLYSPQRLYSDPQPRMSSHIERLHDKIQ